MGSGRHGAGIPVAGFYLEPEQDHYLLPMAAVLCCAGTTKHSGLLMPIQNYFGPSDGIGNIEMDIIHPYDRI